jgi:hypothetical protein
MLRTGARMSVTRLTWVTVAAGVMILGCGEGRAIFNVDVLSYEPQLADTVPYAVPGGTSITQVKDSFGLDLPGGLGNSTVDSVSLLYASTVLNAAGGGKVRLEMFFDSTPGNVFSSSVMRADSAVFSGPDTVLLGPISVPLLADSLFTQSKLWVGVRASVVANAGPTMTGRFVTVSVLRLRIIFQDKVF